jgi:hypothetical protein
MYNQLFEQILNEGLDWFEDIGESFEDFAESVSNAAIGESQTLNEAQIGDHNYITDLLKAEKNYFHIKTQLEFSNERNSVEKRRNLPVDEAYINANTAPSVCIGIDSSTDRMRRLEKYLNSEDNEFKKAILLAAISIYKKMLSSLRDSMDSFNRSVDASLRVQIPEAFESIH